MSPHIELVISPEFLSERSKLNNIKQLFESSAEIIQKGRNTIKITSIGKHRVVIKSFKEPGRIQGLIYRYFRKSKARRSYEYGQQLAANGFQTPSPVAFLEEKTALSLKASYFISLYFEHDFVIRDALDVRIKSNKEIVREFVDFTFNLHKANILHLDHSPGNTLVRKTSDGYQFALVDINRLHFGPINFKQKLENFCRLTKDETTLRAIASRYAELSDKSASHCFSIIETATQQHFNKLEFRRKLKSRIRKN